MFQNVETKVIAAAAGGGAGGVVGTFVLWLLGAGVFGAGFGAGEVQAATAAVPSPVADLIPLILAAVGAFWAGYKAPHTDRPDLAPQPATVTPEPASAPVVADPVAPVPPAA